MTYYNYTNTDCFLHSYDYMSIKYYDYIINVTENGQSTFKIFFTTTH